MHCQSKILPQDPCAEQDIPRAFLVLVHQVNVEMPLTKPMWSLGSCCCVHCLDTESFAGAGSPRTEGLAFVYVTGSHSLTPTAFPEELPLYLRDNKLLFFQTLGSLTSVYLSPVFPKRHPLFSESSVAFRALGTISMNLGLYLELEERMNLSSSCFQLFSNNFS
jgi:hypothetical protein